MSYINKITTKKGTTRWQCRWIVPNPGGGPKERSKNFATQKEAKAHAVQMAEIESRGVGDPRKHDLAHYLRGWLAHLREREDLAPTTMEGYERNVSTPRITSAGSRSRSWRRSTSTGCIRR